MCELIDCSRRKSIINSKKCKDEINQLITKIETLELTVVETNSCHAELAETKALYTQKIESETKAAAFRAKVKILRENETNSKYFLNLKRTNYNKKTMSIICQESGTLTLNPKEILRTQRDFYRKLYQQDKSIRFTLTNDTNVKVKEEDRAALDAMITYEEVTEAVKSLKADKTPGNTGITAEFMQFFWLRLGYIYFEALVYVFKVGELHLSAHRGVITLIPKKGKDALYIKNW